MKLSNVSLTDLLLGGGVVVGVSGLILGVVRYKAWKRKCQLRKKWEEAGENVVVLHQLPRPGKIPNLSPFPIKLETFLRAMNIEYVNDFEEPMSDKQKTPWITINGEDVADSQLVVEFLTDKLGKDMDSHLTEEEEASARAMRIMIEEHLYWGVAVHRWVHDGGEFLENFNSIFGPVPAFIQKRILKQVGQMVNGQARSAGLGRHSRLEMEQMCCKDLVAVSTLLGTKPYMMGEKPSLVDCTVFGFVCQVLHGMPPTCVYRQLVEKELKNLINHFERMKGAFWVDWENL
eukprot:GFUD01045563.1.p1 GENE.GFUD01045563.1~~GFUD01045563.1.p1  ORF type:complete len:289 (+),score=100.67 GFUD01045563.1:119-985(+)